jgi:putative ABC transport system permease protein
VALAADPEIHDKLLASAVRRNVVGMLIVDGRSGIFMGQGTEPAAESRIAPLAHSVAGTLLDASKPTGVLLGAPLAARLGVEPGGTVTAMVTTDQGLTNAMDLTVLGTTMTGAQDLDRAYATLPLDTALSLADGTTADLLVLALTDTADTDSVLAATRRVLADPAFAGLEARPWYVRADYYIAVKALYDRIFGVFEALMVAVTVLSLSHALAAVVAERRAEIAMLRVVGLRRRDVAAIFLAEGALLGVLGCAIGGVGAILLSQIVTALGGIPMPPPPGFSAGYPAHIQLDAIGFVVVLSATFAAAVIASAVPAWRATRGDLSRGLMGLVVLFALSAAHAHAAPPDALANAFGPPPTPDQRCIVDVSVRDGATTMGWRVVTHGADTLAVSTTLAVGRRQAVLESGGATWFQTESMGKAMRIGLAQRMMGRLSAADVIDPRLVAGWQVTSAGSPSTAPALSTAGVITATARPGAGLAYARAEFELAASGLLTTARFYAPSGSLLRSATYTFEPSGGRTAPARLLSVSVSDTGHAGAVTLSLGVPACTATPLTVTPDTLWTTALTLLEPS